MSDSVSTPVRTAADALSDMSTLVKTAHDQALSDLSTLVKTAHDQAIPFSLPRAIELLAEHAELSTHDDVSALSARVDAIEKLLVENGIEQPAAPAPAPATAG